MRLMQRHIWMSNHGTALPINPDERLLRKIAYLDVIRCCTTQTACIARRPSGLEWSNAPGNAALERLLTRSPNVLGV